MKFGVNPPEPSNEFNYRVGRSEAMHEWSLASALISALRDRARRSGWAKVISATVRVGSLSMIDLGLLGEALRALSKSSEFERTEFRVEPAVTRFECRRCGRTWSFSEVKKETLAAVPRDSFVSDESGEQDAPMHYFPELVYAWMKCPGCGSKDYAVRDATGVVLEKVEVE